MSGGWVPSGRPGGLVVGEKDHKALERLIGTFSTREAQREGTARVFLSDPRLVIGLPLAM